MIKSSNFWIGAILLAMIPLLIIDVSQHYFDWQKEVREEIITVVQNLYPFDKQEKAQILDRIFDRNKTLSFLIYVKSFAGIIFFFLSLHFFSRYRKEKESKIWKPIFSAIIIITGFLVIKILLFFSSFNNLKATFPDFPSGEYPFQTLYKSFFSGKVVYVDFWGTTCGPCLQEFRDFIRPLKVKYGSRVDLAYLYVAGGNHYEWKQQIIKYKIDGYHLFLTEDQYMRLYHQVVQDSSATVTMPRYLIIDKEGKVVVTNAKRPSDKDSLYMQLDKFLNKK